MTQPPVTVGVFASGGGSNFQALIDHQARPGCGWRIGLLVTNRAAGAIEKAERAGIEAVVVPTKARVAEDVAWQTLGVLERAGVEVVALAGYLRLLPPEVVKRFEGRLVNVHPALLPDFGGPGMYGMNVHRAVVESGTRVTGPTIHLVDERYDEGAVLAQWQVPVLDGDDAEAVAARVLAAEHQLYPVALDHLCAAVAAGRGVESMGVIHRIPSPQMKEEVR